MLGIDWTNSLAMRVSTTADYFFRFGMLARIPIANILRLNRRGVTFVTASRTL